jgi:hypothetical protein
MLYCTILDIYGLVFAKFVTADVQSSGMSVIFVIVGSVKVVLRRINEFIGLS